MDEDQNDSNEDEDVQEAPESEVLQSAKQIKHILLAQNPWDRENSGLVGFQNLGDTCYMNATLQCLVHCPPLIGLFTSAEFEMDPYGKAPLIQSFTKLMREVWYSKRNALAPRDILSDVMKLNEMFQGFQQQDAQELLLTVLGNLDDMMQRVLPLPPTKKDLEIIAKIEEQERKKAEEMRTLQLGETVVIQGLQEQKYNGSTGKIVAVINEKGRYGVKLNVIGKSLLIKAENLCRQEPEESKSSENPEKKKEKLSRPPKRKAFRSPITDIFSGRLQNETKCLECGHVSKVLNPFQDLSVPIPNSDMVEQAVEERKLAPPPRPGLFSSLLTAVGITNSQITLDMCLHSFCTSEELIESERYHCEKCKKKVEAKKMLSIALLPDVLILHIKRFNYHAGFWGGSKKTTLVEFDATLDMRSYLHPDFLDDPQNKVSEYELYGLVRHSGSLGGGHYIAFCRKPDDRERWWCFDDRSVYEVPLSKVLQKEAYLLFYCRRSKDSVSLQRQVWNLMEKNLNSCNFEDSTDDVYISSYFFRKLKHYCNVGPLDNHRLLCPHGHIFPSSDRRWQHNHLRIPLKSWRALEHKYSAPKQGKIPVINCSDDHDNAFKCIQCQAQQDYHKVAKFMEAKYQTQVKYCIPSQWAQKWREFASPFPSTDVKPPGPIDNTGFLDENGEVPNEDPEGVVHVNEHVWKYLVDVHGGGPPVPRPIRRRGSRQHADSEERESSVS